MSGTYSSTERDFLVSPEVVTEKKRDAAQKAAAILAENKSVSPNLSILYPKGSISSPAKINIPNIRIKNGLLPLKSSQGFIFAKRERKHINNIIPASTYKFGKNETSESIIIMESLMPALILWRSVVPFLYDHGLCLEFIIFYVI